MSRLARFYRTPALSPAATAQLLTRANAALATGGAGGSALPALASIETEVCFYLALGGATAEDDGYASLTDARACLPLLSCAVSRAATLGIATAPRARAARLANAPPELPLP